MSTIRHTLGEEIYWRYAQMGLVDAWLKNKGAGPKVLYYSIRAKLYKGLRTGSMSMTSFFKDEYEKIGMTVCCYCGKSSVDSIDHLIPRKKLGSDLSENLVPACQHCNSSKGEKDMIVWLREQDRIPSIFLLRRYMKLIFAYCKDNSLLEVPLHEIDGLRLPFPVSSLTDSLNSLYFPEFYNLLCTMPFDFNMMDSLHDKPTLN